MVLRVAALAVLGALAIVQGAVAKEVATRGEITGGPFLAGDRVVWSEQRCIQGCAVYVRCDPEGETHAYAINTWLRRARRPQTLFRKRLECASSGPSFFEQAVSFLASATRFLVWETQSEGADPGGESDVVRARFASYGGPLEPLLRCTGEAVRAFALDGDVLAYDPTPCDGATDELVLHDLTTGTRRSVRLPQGSVLSQLALAGPYVAWADGNAAVVYDQTRGAEAYRVVMPPRRYVMALALQNDGALALRTAVTGYACRAPQLTWHSPAEPQGRRLPSNGCGALKVGNQHVYTQDSERRALVVIDPTGQTRTLTRLGALSTAPVPFDVDAGLLAYALPSCAGGSILSVRGVRSTPFAAGDARCPARIASGRLRATSGGVVRVALRCPRGCAGDVALRLERRVIARRGFRLSAARRARALSVRLSRRGRRQLRAYRAVAVTIVVSTKDRAGRGHRISRRTVLTAGP